MGQITVGIGDAHVSNDPADLIVTHALGSCIAVAIHDSAAGVAGLLHFLLPDSKSSAHKAMTHPCMFADTGIPALFHAAYARGAQKSRLSVRVVGGAQVLDPQGVFNIGKQNYMACRKILWAAGVLIAAEEVGGNISRTVRLAVDSGRLEWNTGGGPGQELSVRSRTGPAAVRPAEPPSPTARAKVAVCGEFLRTPSIFTAALPVRGEVPLGARARAPWCDECVKRNLASCPASHADEDLAPEVRAQNCNEFRQKGGR